MAGRAQALFQERHGRSPWRIQPKPPQLIDKILTAGSVSTVDVLLAQKLLGQQSVNDALMAVVSHLSAAARHGHLSICVRNGEVLPSPEQFEKVDSKDVLTPSDLQQWKALISKGFQELPFYLIQEEHSPLHKQNDALYFVRFWNQEEALRIHLDRIMTHKPTLAPNASKIESQIRSLIDAGRLLPEQAQAIRTASNSALTIISGGPGTGKTYTAALFIEVFLNALSPEESQRYQIALAAPTGKAAANLEANLGKSLALKAKTLHSLLNIKPHQEQHAPALNADLILVDETSMVDSKIMSLLLSATKEGARIVLLGDKDQLPPVEAGTFFVDLLTKNKAPTVFLSTCLRTESKAILNLAAAINRGDSDALHLPSDTIHHIAIDNTQATRQQFITKTLPHYQFKLDSITDSQSLTHLIRKFRVLGALKKGFWGVDTLNALLHEQHLRSHHGPLTLPIMITENDATSNLLNGELGLLIQHPTELPYALFPQQTLRRLPLATLPRFEYAYCISIHKSQGSEFDSVTLLLPPGHEVFGRQLLYTGVTRARHNLTIAISPK